MEQEQKTPLNQTKKKSDQVREEIQDNLKNDIKADAAMHSHESDYEKNCAEFSEEISRIKCMRPRDCNCGGRGFIGFARTPGGDKTLVTCKNAFFGETEYSRMSRLFRKIAGQQDLLLAEIRAVRTEQKRGFWDKLIHGRK